MPVARLFAIVELRQCVQIGGMKFIDRHARLRSQGLSDDDVNGMGLGPRRCQEWQTKGADLGKDVLESGQPGIFGWQDGAKGLIFAKAHDGYQGCPRFHGQFTKTLAALQV